MTGFMAGKDRKIEKKTWTRVIMTNLHILRAIT